MKLSTQKPGLEKSNRWKMIKSALPKIFLDLLIVFSGVSLAFYLSNISERNREKKQIIQYHHLFKNELQLLAHVLKQNNLIIDSAYTQFTRERSNGKRPVPQALQLEFPFRGLVIEASISGDNFSALSPDILKNITAGSSRVKLLENQIHSFNEYVKTVLVPNLDSDISEFYNADGTLKKKYQWYPEKLLILKNHTGQLEKVISGQAIPDVEQSIRHLE
jgi:hypothetical protein